MVGDGNVFTCVEDLFLWDQNFYHNKLGKGGQELIHQVLTTGTLNGGEKIDYAFGLVIGDYRDCGSSSTGRVCWVSRNDNAVPGSALSVIMQCNLGTMNPSKSG